MYYILMFVLTFIFSFVAAWLDLPKVLTFSVIFFLIFPSIFYLKFSPLLWTKDVDKTEKHLKKNLKDPMSYLYYATANKLDEEVEIAIEKVLKKYKNETRQALFKTIHALYKKDIKTAEEHVALITPVEYRNYYEAAIAIEKGKTETAESLVSSVKIPWMKEALLSEIALKRGKKDQAKQHASKAIDRTRGVQRYQLYKTYEHEGLLD